MGLLKKWSNRSKSCGFSGRIYWADGTKTRAMIEEARGGILFVDEAYSLTSRGDDGKDFGKEVIEVIIKEMSDGPGDIAFIFAGYPKEMRQFWIQIPGFHLVSET